MTDRQITDKQIEAGIPESEIIESGIYRIGNETNVKFRHIRRILEAMQEAGEENSNDQRE